MNNFSVLQPSSQISFGWIYFISFFIASLLILSFCKNRIHILITLLFLFIPFREEFVFFAGATWRLSDIFGIQLVGFTILAILQDPRNPKYSNFPIPLILIMIFYIAIGFLSLAFSPPLPHGVEGNFSGRNVPELRGLTQLARWIYAFTLIYSLYVNIESKEQFQRLIKTLCITACIISSFSIIFYLLWKTELIGRPLASIFVDRINPHRISGLDFEPSNFSYYLVITMILSAWEVYTKRLKIFRNHYSWVILAPQIAAFTFCQSAIGLLILGSALFLTFLEIRFQLYRFKKRTNLPVTGIVLGLCITLMSVLIFMGITDRPRFLFNPTLKAASFFGRVGGITTDLNMYAAHPELGVGIGKYMYHFSDYIASMHPVGEKVKFSGFQSVFTGAFAETGLLGGLSITFFVLYLLLHVHKRVTIDLACGTAEIVPYFTIFIAAAVYLSFSPFLLGHTVLIPLILPLLASRVQYNKTDNWKGNLYAASA